MWKRTRRAELLAAALVLSLHACASAPAPTTEAAPASSPAAGRTASAPTRRDVHFMQGMIGHHAQALDMSALVPSRTPRPEMKLLAERIVVSQRDEIDLMRRWLRNRNQPLPPDDAHVHALMGHGDMMPGMLTQAEMDRLAGARGAEFDRLFLESMIRHHEGALRMVADLLSQQGTLDAETFQFASDVDADQRAEITRMRALLKTLP